MIMLGDLTEKIQSSQNKFEKLTARIPGYAGYKQKEQRREADKLLRLYVAQAYQDQLARLNELQYTLTTRGQLSAVSALDRSSSKLQRLIDRIKTASYGYAGLFDAVKVDEAALDKLYDFDQAMLDGAGSVAALLDQLAEGVAGEADVAAITSQLATELDNLNQTFSQRREVILS